MLQNGLGVVLTACSRLSLKPYRLYIPGPSINVQASFLECQSLFGQKGEVGYFFIETAVFLSVFHEGL